MRKFYLFASAAVLLFGGCSQELTEDLDVLAPVGKHRIIASYETEASTRSHLEREGNDLVFGWDSGDALGLFAAPDGEKPYNGDVSNAYFGYSGGSFDGDLYQVKGNDLFAYYPWASGKEIKVEDGVAMITLSIPAKQDFNHKYSKLNQKGDRYDGSYASGVVPAVAKTDAPVDKTQTEFPLTVKPVAAYIGVPFRGIGTIESLKLKIKDNSTSDYINLAGDVKVELTKPTMVKDKNGKDTEEVETFFTIDNSLIEAGDVKEITLNCGDGVLLDRNIPKTFVFVIPANVKLPKGLTLEVTVQDGQVFTFSVPTLTNTDRNRLKNIQSADFVWVDAGKYMVDTPAKFIEYAYVATKGIGASGVSSTDRDMLTDGGQLKSALITENLTLGAYTAGTDNFTKAVAKWYQNGGFTTAIGGIEPFSLEGNVLVDDKDGNPATIKGMKVKGQSLFAPVSGANATITNIVLEGAELTDGSYFLGADMTYYGNSKLTIKGGKMDKAGSIAQYLYTSQLDVITVDEYPTNADLLSESLYVNADVTIGDEYITPAFRFKQVESNPVSNGTQGALVTVESKTSASAFIQKIVRKEGKWFSVVTRDEDGKVATSYWTGQIAGDHKVETLTAERLARVVSVGGNGKGEEFTMTNNICMLYNDYNRTLVWPAKHDATRPVVLHGGGYTIEEVSVGENGLFGCQADIDNVTIKLVHIYYPAEKEDAEPFVLAKTGTAVNVTTSILTYHNVKAEALKDGYVAGLFYEGTADQAMKTSGCNVNFTATSLPENVKFGALYGKVNFDLGINYTFEGKNTLNGYTPYAVFNCYQDGVTGEGHPHNNTTSIYFKNGLTKNNGLDAKAIVRWDTDSKWGGTIGSEHTVFILFGNETETTNYIKYDGKKTDLQSIMEAAEKGENVTFGEDIKASGVIKQNGGTIDGAGHTLVSSSNVAGIQTTGGTIKNLTIEGGAWRGVYTTALEKDLILDNCDLSGAYALNTNLNPEKNAIGKTLKATDCDFRGWFSWTTKAEFNRCTMHIGTYFDYETNLGAKENHWNEMFRAYAESTFTECNFDDGIIIALHPRYPIADVDNVVYTFNGCTYGGQPMNYENATWMLEFDDEKDIKDDDGKVTGTTITHKATTITIVIDGKTTTLTCPTHKN